jgi:small basic protein (TIGR04137 family)
MGSQKGKRHRSVLKRYEKLKHLVEKSKWDEEKDSIYRLPKIKSIKFKVKKEKSAAAAAEGEALAAPGQAAPAAGAQPQAPAAAPGKQAGAEKPAAKDKKAKT